MERKMSDSKTRKHNMGIIENVKANAIDSLDSAVNGILYCGSTEELHRTPQGNELDAIGLQIVKLMKQLKGIEIK